MVEADKILKDLKIRHLPVMKDNRIVGMISDRDIQRAMSTVISSGDKLQGHLQPHKKVYEFMSSPVRTMKKNEPVEKLTREMVTQKMSSMIIEDEDGYPIGIITTEDLLVLLLDMLQHQTKRIKKIKKIFMKLVSTKS